MYEVKNKEFLKTFDELCYMHDRLNIFSDFVKLCAISIYNSFAHNQAMEDEYLRIIKSYNEKEQKLFPKLFGELIMMYEECNEVIDILGPIYMNTKSKDKHLGQVFTPAHISEFMAECLIGNENSYKEEIKKKGYITINDPACGSGGLVLAYANVLKKHNINYQQNLLVNVTDIDSLCVYMAYIQLSLYGVPAVVYCGDTLTQKMNFKMETPLFFLNYWRFRSFNQKNNNEDQIQEKNNDIIIPETIENQNLYKEVTIKGNCQISLW